MGGAAVEVGGKAEDGPSLLLGHREWCCALNRRLECKPQDRLIRLLAAVWHPINSD